MNGTDWMTYMYDLHGYVKEQDRKIQELTQKLEQLETNLNEQNTNRVEKIEYKFDQLKIENLNGTLHIGMSPQDLNNVEDFSMPDQSLPPTTPPLKQQLVSELSSFVQQECPALIRNLSEEYERKIDKPYQNILLQDVTKQLPSRVAFYEKKAADEKIESSDLALHDYIANNIKEEIHNSLIAYMQTFDKKEE
ncbi:spore germination protein GerPC [Oceanobacillus manasiensis]|uniref:spore germination protein GerPC n=1 Tax=Oceanobacillus manasiensis TaxID=586413 RepID=UPI0005A9BAF7|nr:spore germination protein GerPC [Oceanobacillus manasiensis]